MSVSVLGVVGAGFMGSGIAESAARAGKQVIVYESEQAPLERSRERIAASVSKAVARGKASQEDATALTDRVIHTTRLEDLCGADAVIEAVFEDRRVKGDLFALMDETFPDALFLASNTSSIAIAELAARTERPERVVGMHFFSPVPVMKLVELVPAIDTAPETVAAAEVFVEEIGKHAIHTKDRSGFIVNVMLFPYLMSAVRLYEDGFASREDIDEGMTLGCGHPMGPLTLCDFIGLDVMDAICESLYMEFKQPEYAPPPLLKRMVISGHLGRKTGRGFYDYTASATTATPEARS